MIGERTARLLVLTAVLGIPLTLLIVRRETSMRTPGRTVEIHGRMPEQGGWTPRDLSVTAGEPLRLRLTSDDVVHGFAIGQMSTPALDLYPGEVVETTITFERPGKYVFYCTRWCGPNHWRMRGTIEVSGMTDIREAVAPPLYVSLGLDLDAPHPAGAVPTRRPSAARAESLRARVADQYLSPNYYRKHTPVALWRSLRTDPGNVDLSDMDVWDLVARVWRRNTTPEARQLGRELYAANCAACHGEGGAGDGVMADALASDSTTALQAGDTTGEFGHGTVSPANFTDAERMLGASPALLQGKIVRGGMGTGMPYWGPILTEAETWAIVSHLWSFQLDLRSDGAVSDQDDPERSSGM